MGAPEETNGHASQPNGRAEQNGRSPSVPQPQGKCTQEETRGKRADSCLPQMTPRCPTPAADYLPSQHTGREQQPPRVRVSPPAGDADQKGTQQAGHEQGDGTSEPVPPTPTHIPDQYARGAHGKNEFDSGLQCHDDLSNCASAAAANRAPVPPAAGTRTDGASTGISMTTKAEYPARITMELRNCVRSFDGALEPATHGGLVRGILSREASLQIPLLFGDHDEGHDGHRCE